VVARRIDLGNSNFSAGRHLLQLPPEISRGKPGRGRGGTKKAEKYGMLGLCNMRKEKKGTGTFQPKGNNRCPASELQARGKGTEKNAECVLNRVTEKVGGG